MQDLLQQLDLDYYRSALLVVARAELERLRRERSAGTDVERGSKTPCSVVPAANGAGSRDAPYGGLPYGYPAPVRCE